MLSYSYFIPLFFQFTFRGALGHALGPLQPLFWRVIQKEVKCLKVEPRQVFWKLQLSTGDVSPHGPAQDGKAAFACLNVDRHLPEVVQAELGSGSHLQTAQTQAHFSYVYMCVGDMMHSSSCRRAFTCRAPSRKGSMRGHMLTLSTSMSEGGGTRQAVDIFT